MIDEFLKHQVLFTLFLYPRVLYKPDKTLLSLMSGSDWNEYKTYILKQLNTKQLNDLLTEKLIKAKDIDNPESKNYLLEGVSQALKDIQENIKIDQNIDYLFENSELIGDFILEKVVEDIMKDVDVKFPERKYDECKSTLTNLLNSNKLLKEILNRFNFDLSILGKLILSLPIRTSRRSQISRKEKKDYDCIDFKYTSNFFEQFIFLSYFLLQDIKSIKKSYLTQLAFIGFDPMTYMEYCYKNQIYPGLKFKTGCSCPNKMGERICDNPGPLNTRIVKIESMECPLECSPQKSKKKSKSKSNSKSMDMDIQMKDVVLERKKSKSGSQSSTEPTKIAKKSGVEETKKPPRPKRILIPEAKPKQAPKSEAKPKQAPKSEASPSSKVKEKSKQTSPRKSNQRTKYVKRI